MLKTAEKREEERKAECLLESELEKLHFGRVFVLGSTSARRATSNSKAFRVRVEKGNKCAAASFLIPPLSLVFCCCVNTKENKGLR